MAYDSHDDSVSDSATRTSVFPGSGSRAVAWVLEDSRQQAAAVEAALQPLLQVRLFHDAPALLEALSMAQPDILLLDWQVPDISGLEVLAIVRQRFDEVTLPALMMTVGQREHTGPLEALQAGANDFVGKPFLAAELRARVSSLVRVRSLHSRARRAERELAVSEERLRRVVEASGAGLFELDVRTGEVAADERMRSLMGVKRGATMTFENGFSSLHPQDEPRLRAAVEGALRGEQGGSYLIEFRTGGDAGTPPRWVESRAQVTFDEHGAPTRLAGALVDITARKEVEREREQLLSREVSRRNEAQRERAKLYNLFQQAPVAMAVLEGPEHVFTFANGAYRALVNGRDLVGKSLHEALPDVRSLGFDAMLDGVMRTGEQLVVNEMRIALEHHLGDDALILNFACNAKTNERGERDGVVMFGWDVTELVRARQGLAQLSALHQASEAQLRLVTNSIPLLVSFVTPDETYGMVNKAYEDWFGVSMDELRGRKVRDFIGEAAYAVLGPYVKRGLAGERITFEQHNVPYRHGGRRDVRVSFVPLTLENEARNGYVALLEDITEQRAAAAEREELGRQHTADLERRTRFEQQLIGIVSHDLRTPLNVIALSSARLARDEEQTVAARKNVVRIQNATDRAVRMVADLLDFTQARLGGGIPIERQRSDIVEAMHDLVAELEAAYPERTIAYAHEGPCEVLLDAGRVSQLAQNLITNALKYSPADSKVDVATRVEQDWLTLSVHNGGTPIPAETLQVLFEPMQRGIGQLDRATRSVGLGLYIVKEIAEAHGGSIGVVSQQREGTTFTARLYAGLVAAESERSSAPSPSR